MVRPDYFNNADNLPEYYDGMYLDGFEPWQIMEAFHRTARRMVQEQRQQQFDDYTINFNTNVRMKQ